MPDRPRTPADIIDALDNAEVARSAADAALVRAQRRLHDWSTPGRRRLAPAVVEAQRAKLDALGGRLEALDGEIATLSEELDGIGADAPVDGRALAARLGRARYPGPGQG